MIIRVKKKTHIIIVNFGYIINLKLKNREEVNFFPIFLCISE